MTRVPRLARSASLLAIAVAAVLMAIHGYGLGRSPQDDAFISFRYARNLIEGHGLVFNSGERVEGYTNFLWTVMLAPALALGIDPLEAARALGTLCAIATLLVLSRGSMGEKAQAASAW